MSRRKHVHNGAPWEDLAGYRRAVCAGKRVFIIMPATTMAKVSRLIDPDMVAEIEADALLDTARPAPKRDGD